MYGEISRLIMYRELGESGSILKGLSEVVRDFKLGGYDKTDLISRIYSEIRKLLEISTNYGFDKNLWHDYIAYIIASNENPFSLTAERAEIKEGSVEKIVLGDMKIFNRLYAYDFSFLEKSLGINCFTTISSYSSIHKRSQLYNRNVSDKIRKLSDAIGYSLENCKNTGASEDEAAVDTLEIVNTFYRKYGVGIFGLNAAFRIVEGTDDLKFVPINNTESVMLDDLIGYDIQKNRLRQNTEAFLAGKPANNVLLFGDAGTGKSTSIKALINEYYNDGIRMIELYKHQMRQLSSVISAVKSRNYRFIIYMDDLSFEEDETEYKYLKAVIEGGLENRPDNVLIYATSNRRNLIRETWNDTKDVELDKHRSDTLQEKLSLVSRFGVTIPYMRPNKKEFEEIIVKLAEKEGLIGDSSDESGEKLSRESLLAEANKWSVGHGGMSGRVARQLLDGMS